MKDGNPSTLDCACDLAHCVSNPLPSAQWYLAGLQIAILGRISHCNCINRWYVLSVCMFPRCPSFPPSSGRQLTCHFGGTPLSFYEQNLTAPSRTTGWVLQGTKSKEKTFLRNGCYWRPQHKGFTTATVMRISL